MLVIGHSSVSMVDGIWFLNFAKRHGLFFLNSNTFSKDLVDFGNEIRRIFAIRVWLMIPPFLSYSKLMVK